MLCGWEVIGGSGVTLIMTMRHGVSLTQTVHLDYITFTLR